MVLTVYLLTLLLVRTAVTDILQNTRVRMEKFEQCDDRKDYPNTFENIVISQEAMDKIVLYGNFIIRKEITAPLTAKLMIYKCRSKENKDLCEYVFTYRNSDFCSQITNTNTMWYSYWKQTKFPRSCPLPKGNYSLNGLAITMGVSNFWNLGLSEGYWKARSSGTSAGWTWHCLNTEFEFRKAEKKRRMKTRGRG